MQNSQTNVLMRSVRKGKPFLDSILSALYPPLCLSCGVEIVHAGLCQECWPETQFITGTVCDSCGTPLLGDEDGAYCDACIHTPTPWNKGRAAVVYDGGGRRIVMSLKHGDRLDMGKHMAKWMQHAGGQVIGTADVIVPVPLHWTRFLKRRYNQAAILAEHIAKSENRAYEPEALSRRKKTVTQNGMKKEERFENLEGAIEVSSKFQERLKNKNVLLVDDVLTTGATLSACADACISAGCENVNVLVFARVARPI